MPSGGSYSIKPEQTEEWIVQRGHYMTLETLALIRDDLLVSLPVGQRR